MIGDNYPAKTYTCRDFQVKKPPFFSYQLIEYIYKHPRLCKIVTLAVTIFTLAALISLPFTLPIFMVGAISIAISTGLVAIICLVAYSKFKSIIGFPHKIEHHAYKEFNTERVSLKYVEHIPILTINSTDPKEIGHIHGYYLGQAIHSLRNRFKNLGLLHEAKKIAPVIEEIKKFIQPDFIVEMEGLAEGFNKWANERKFWSPKKLTLEEVIAFHLVPENIHFKSKLSNPVGCTAILEKDENNEMIFGRTVDWPSGGVAGLSLIMCLKTKDGNEYASIGVPGITGPITGISKSGLALSMNVCKDYTKTIAGMPAVFLNKLVLQNYSKVDEAVTFLKTQRPLGPYHMTLADSTNAIVCRLNQHEKNEHKFESEFPKKITNELPPNFKAEPQKRKGWKKLLKKKHNSEYKPNIFWNNERQHILDIFLKNKNKMNKVRLVSESLRLPYVNNPYTTQIMVMRPGATEKQTIISLAFANAFVGNAPLIDLKKEDIFP